MPLAEVVSDNHQTKNVNSTIAIERVIFNKLTYLGPLIII